MNLFEKIQAVSNDIKNIEKDMQVGNSNYGYRAVSDNIVTQSVKASETKHRILSIPIKQDLVGSQVIRVKKTDGKETINYVDDIKMTLRIIDLDDPTQHIDVESFGKGLDSGDKGFGKAATYARKYALLNAYKIATGEDLDINNSKEQEVMTEDKRLDAIKNVLAQDTNLALNISKHFAVETADDLKENQIKTIYADFKKKGRL